MSYLQDTYTYTKSERLQILDAKWGCKIDGTLIVIDKKSQKN